MRLNCDGPQHETEGCDLRCPFGTFLREGQTWESCCEDCRDELDRWADMYGSAVRDTQSSRDLKDRE